MPQFRIPSAEDLLKKTNEDLEAKEIMISNMQSEIDANIKEYQDLQLENARLKSDIDKHHTLQDDFVEIRNKLQAENARLEEQLKQFVAIEEAGK